MSTMMCRGYFGGAVTLRIYRLSGHAVVSGLIKVAQKLENAVQPVWVGVFSSAVEDDKR